MRVKTKYVACSTKRKSIADAELLFISLNVTYIVADVTCGGEGLVFVICGCVLSFLVIQCDVLLKF